MKVKAAARATDYRDQFLQQGFAIVPAVDLRALETLREQVFAECRKLFDHKGTDAEAFFNDFHKLKITGAKLNELRLKIIEACTKSVDSGNLIFTAFRDVIVELVGPDLLVQKTTNLVIQQPGDPNPSELHRDAPQSSPYELVAWVPLVDCFGSKCMYILDREKTAEAMAVIDRKPDDWPGFEAYCIKAGQPTEVPFGSGMFFWTGLFHGSQVNTEGETRFSLNMRYKSLFSPTGTKDTFEFFKVMRLSPLAKLGLSFQKAQLLP